MMWAGYHEVIVTFFMNGVQGNAARPAGAPADEYTPYEKQTGGQVCVGCVCVCVCVCVFMSIYVCDCMCVCIAHLSVICTHANTHTHTRTHTHTFNNNTHTHRYWSRCTTDPTPATLTHILPPLLRGL